MQDHLRTHNGASRYETFSPAAVRKRIFVSCAFIPLRGDGSEAGFRSRARLQEPCRGVFWRVPVTRCCEEWHYPADKSWSFPGHFMVLVCAFRAMLHPVAAARRAWALGEELAMQYEFGDFTLDTERYELWRAETLLKLQPKVFDVLVYLIAHRERVVSKQELLEQSWPGQFISEATLNSCIRAVRRAVGDSGQAQRVIHTLHGRGFRFVADSAVRRHELLDDAMPPSLAIASLLEPLGSPVAGGPVWGPSTRGDVKSSARRQPWSRRSTRW